MILDKLFLQYKKNNKPWFGSLWMNLHGRFLIGDPKKLGLDNFNPDLLKTYYYDKVDRFTKPKDIVEFRKDNLRLMYIREAERPRISFAVWITSTFIIILLALVFASTVKTTTAIGSNGHSLSLSASASATLKKKMVACHEFVDELHNSGQNTTQADLNYIQECRSIQQQLDTQE